MEVKSSPPKHIEQAEVKAFLNRMKDKIVPFFEEELLSRHGKVAVKRYPVVRKKDELFQINHQVFIVNSKRDVIANFRDCFRDYWRSLIMI